MRMFTGKRVWQKFLIALLTIVLLFQFVLPVRSYAGLISDIGEGIVEAFKELAKNAITGIAHLTASIGDLAMSAFNNFMLGTEGFGTAMLSQEALDYSPDDGKTYSWFHIDEDKDYVPSGESSGSDVSVKDENGKTVVYVNDDYLDNEIGINDSEWEIPNILYCPENIFGNNISLLDVNFLNPNDYSSVVESGRGEGSAEEASESIGESLKVTISGWYKAFRNIAVVALLSILVYLGIRILISSTAEDKAKYKEILKDWTIALVLVFVMHFIMSAAIMVVNLANNLFKEFNNNVYVSVSNGVMFKSNFMGVIRFLAQAETPADAWAYTIVYLVLVIYTFTFTIQYLKRVLYIAFYTMISPLVAITYPMDKLADRKITSF